MRIPWTKYARNDDVLEKTQRKFILNIKKGHLTLLGRIMKRTSLENMILTGQIEGKSDRGK